MLILDEPTIGLDPRQTLEVRDLVRSLGKNHTVMFSTHILSEAEQVCDRVVIIHRGAIVAMDKPQALRDQLQKARGSSCGSARRSQPSQCARRCRTSRAWRA